jgi:2-amino-4-hydroxy-6-hydroxymethyldihydropteridine diphosphokinase
MSSEGTCYIGLGGNLGDRCAFLLTALEHLETQKYTIIALSSLYESAPMYLENQPLFLNAAIRVTTGRDPLEMLNELMEIEIQMGRKRTDKYGPRVIDLDLLLWGNDGTSTYDSSLLTIPHPRIKERPFVLVPLKEIAETTALSSLNLPKVESGVQTGLVRHYDKRWENRKRR